MKKEKRSVVVKLSTITSKVIDGSWSWPAGKSGFCNHVMALLLGLAEYSLSQFKSALDKKMKFSIRDFFSKCDQIHRKLPSYLQKTSLMEKVHFFVQCFYRRNYRHKQASPMVCTWRNYAKRTSNGNYCLITSKF